MITGESGTGKSILAQCIHNESLMRKNAFVPLDCSAWMPETLDNMLFGNYSLRHDTGDSMAELAQNGTLYLSHVEALPLETQYKLLNLIRGRFLHNGSNRPTSTSVRVIASSDVNLISRVEKGEFRSDLYYALTVLSLELLPLRRRRADIMGWVNCKLQEWQERYKRYVHLTQGAQNFLQAYDWPGNLNQIDNVCERIVPAHRKAQHRRGLCAPPAGAGYPQAAARLRPGGALQGPEGGADRRAAAQVQRQPGAGGRRAGRQQDHPVALYQKVRHRGGLLLLKCREKQNRPRPTGLGRFAFI